MQDIILNTKPKYKFTLENFEGPLDLLIYLISKNKMNIFDISLSKLTDEYVNYINKLNEKNIEVASEFIVMAATLLDIKARKLLPEIEPKEDDEDVLTEEDILNKIIEYKKYKEISAVINDMYSENFGSFSKSYEKIKFKKNVEYTGNDFTKDSIFNTYTLILERNISKINKKSKELDKIAIYEKVTVQDKVKQIVNYLNNNNTMVFNSVFDPVKCDNIEIVTAFLGALELSRLKQVDIEQKYLFSDINIKKRNDTSITVNLSDINE